MDHLAGLAYYLSQRHFQGMKPGTILLPRELAQPTDLMLRCWRDVEKQGTPYTLIPMTPNSDHEVRRDFLIRAVETHHGGCCLGYSLISVREKLKQEFMGTPGPELAALRKKGVEIQYRLEVPLVTYLGDTSAGPVFDHPDVQKAEILITECTFFDPTHKQRAKVGKHLHLDELVGILPKLKNQHLVITHVSRRISVRRARNLLRRKIGEERMKNIHFLMDFEGATAAGEVEEAGPPVSDTAE
jgi:ribonuclease Z